MFAESLSRIVFLALLIIACSTLARAQEPDPAAQATPLPTPLTAPPPIKAIPKTEKLELDGSSDPKQRVRQTIEFAGGHLSTAEKYTTQSNFEAASHEVGSYQALIENVLTFLATMKRGSNKTRDLYKKMELALRADAPRLTAMRRSTPIEYAVWIKKTEDFAREGRTEALNSFYGDTVVRDPEKPIDKHKPPPKVQQP
ncbi:MAG: hypothetical protein DMF69_02725 [Acidobacteria bacterium]|nr:MAG: hypothetical protein DMF69_02725 [Acidobacteriota bacterium]